MSTEVALGSVPTAINWGCAPIGDLDRLRPAALRALRARLSDLGANRETFSAGLLLPPGVPERLRRPLAWRALRRRGSPAALLAILFAYAGRADIDPIRSTLGPDVYASLAAAGILEEDRSEVHSNFRLVPFYDCWILADEPAAGVEAAFPPGPTTSELMRLLPHEVGSALDLGCGPGSLAIAMARRGVERVVATDISVRACAMARFNARLNDVGVEIREGDLYAPVEDERFDLIVSQPPYVIKPTDEARVAYLHGGEQGDEIALAVLAQAPAHLSAEGVGIVMFDTVARPKNPFASRLSGVMAGTDAEPLTISMPGMPADMQAAVYAELAAPLLDRDLEAIADRYRRHLENIDADGARHVVVVIRHARSARPPSVLEVPVTALPDSWSQIQSFQDGAEVARRSDEMIMQAMLRPREGASIRSTCSLTTDATAAEHTLTFPPGSIACDRKISEEGVSLLRRLASGSPAATMINELALHRGLSPEEARAVFVAFLRMGLNSGFLVVDEPASANGTGPSEWNSTLQVVGHK